MTRISDVQFEVCRKLENIVLMDDYNDWTIFYALAKKKGLDVSKLDGLHAIKQSSGYDNLNQEFAKPKIEWINSLLNVNTDKKVKRIFTSIDLNSIFMIVNCSLIFVADHEYSFDFFISIYI